MTDLRHRIALVSCTVLLVSGCGDEGARERVDSQRTTALATPPAPAIADSVVVGDTAIALPPDAAESAVRDDSARFRAERTAVDGSGDDVAAVSERREDAAVAEGAQRGASPTGADSSPREVPASSTREVPASSPREVPPPPTRGDAASADDAPPPRPFDVGERLTYDVKFGPLTVGTATMQVLGIETVRGRPAYHTRFEVRGGNRLYRVHDQYESWFDARSLASLRYVQDIDQGSYERRSVYEIYPDEARYVEQGKEPQPSVDHPLDEGSFIYWLRTIPLEVGKTYSFDRYFRPDRNPVRIEVLRRERVTVPAGTFDAIVVRPVIKTRGIFSEGGRAEIWFAADSTRRMLQMKSKLSFGSLNLYLK